MRRGNDVLAASTEIFGEGGDDSNGLIHQIDTSDSLKIAAGKPEDGYHYRDGPAVQAKFGFVSTWPMKVNAL